VQAWSNAGVEPSDRELLLRLARGEREALQPLLERHHRRVYRIALAYLRNADDALDVVQETFVKVFENAARWDSRSEVLPWLTRIAVNQAIDRYRRERRRRETLLPLAQDDHHENLGDPDPSPERRALGRDAARRIDAALLALPERQRAVFVLRHYQEMSLEEIAASLRLPLGTVKSSLHRAIHELRHRLWELRA
jgi:RNA polymerase sigma-70 factor (ECF subfamily)